VCNFFFRDCAWAHFSLRREEKSLQRAGYREVEPTPDLALNDYKITVLRPGDRPKALATISKRLKPAWTQRTISSATLSTTSWIVRTRRSKVLLFLSFQKSQQTRTTIESKPLRPIFGTSFLAASHQSDRLVVWVEGATISQPSHRSTLNQISREKGQPTSKWSMVSGNWEHKTHVSSLCSPCWLKKFYTKEVTFTNIETYHKTKKIYC